LPARLPHAAEAPSATQAPPAADAPHTVAVLVHDGLIPFELGIPFRIFGTARTSDGRPLYEVLLCAPDGPRPVPTDAGFTVDVPHGPEVLERAGTVVIPAAHGARPEFDEGRLSPATAAALARVRPGARLVSICTGAFFLAAAGLLDGLPATTHWAHADHLRRLHPDVLVQPDVLCVDNGSVLTSAGVAAGLDVCLHLVRRDHGAAVANDVARRTVVPPHREGGQAQFIRRPVPAGGLPSTAAARAWALDRLDRPLALRELAARESMSVRTFTRRFREEMGVSPGQWLTQQRVERTRHLLETTDLTVDRIAELTGFGTAASLRQRLRETLGVSPSAYRRTFRFTKN
jgi:transcriptional regulator GlxA family with amidase domain